MIVLSFLTQCSKILLYAHMYIQLESVSIQGSQNHGMFRILQWAFHPIKEDIINLWRCYTDRQWKQQGTIYPGHSAFSSGSEQGWRQCYSRLHIKLIPGRHSGVCSEKCIWPRPCLGLNLTGCVTMSKSPVHFDLLLSLPSSCSACHKGSGL